MNLNFLFGTLSLISKAMLKKNIYIYALGFYNENFRSEVYRYSMHIINSLDCLKHHIKSLPMEQSSFKSKSEKILKFNVRSQLLFS